MKPRWRKS